MRYVARQYPAYWLKVDLPHKLAHARFVREAEQEGRHARRPAPDLMRRGASPS